MRHVSKGRPYEPKTNCIAALLVLFALYKTRTGSATRTIDWSMNVVEEMTSVVCDCLTVAMACEVLYLVAFQTLYF
jgi:hypothetical protein